MIKRLNILLIFALMTTSCIQQLEWEGDDTSGEVLVVEGLLTSEEGPHYVLLSLTNPVISESTRIPATGANVEIISGTQSWVLGEVAAG